MKVKTMTPVIDDLCALHFTIPDILLCTDESRIKLDVSGVDNRRLRQISKCLAFPSRMYSPFVTF